MQFLLGIFGNLGDVNMVVSFAVAHTRLLSRPSPRLISSLSLTVRNLKCLKSVMCSRHLYYTLGCCGTILRSTRPLIYFCLLRPTEDMWNNSRDWSGICRTRFRDCQYDEITAAAIGLSHSHLNSNNWRETNVWKWCKQTALAFWFRYILLFCPALSRAGGPCSLWWWRVYGCYHSHGFSPEVGQFLFGTRPTIAQCFIQIFPQLLGSSSQTDSIRHVSSSNKISGGRPN